MVASFARMRVRYYASPGKLNGAARPRRPLATAMAMYRELDTPFWAAKVDAETGRTL